MGEEAECGLRTGRGGSPGRYAGNECCGEAERSGVDAASPNGLDDLVHCVVFKVVWRGEGVSLAWCHEGVSRSAWGASSTGV